MKRIITSLALAAALVVGALGITPTAATATPDVPAAVVHATTNEASWTCAATRPIALGQYVLHAHLLVVAVGYRRYRCETWNFVSGAGSHGCQYDAAYIDGTGPFGPIDDFCY